MHEIKLVDFQALLENCSEYDKFCEKENSRDNVIDQNQLIIRFVTVMVSTGFLYFNG